MAILITGSAGFIGTNLCEELLKKGEKVIGIDNYITGTEENTKYLKDNYINYNFYEGDICNLEIFEKINNIKLKNIYHLASLASPDKYKKYPLETMNVNIQGTVNILNLAKKNKSKFLFSSTSEIYGDPLIHPQTESYFGNVNIIGPRSCYDESKRAGETYVHIFRTIDKENYNNYKIVRIFNSYGPRMSLEDGRVITNFIKQILNNKPLYIYGSGLQTRSFCYITDMVDGLIKMMESDETGPINLGNPYCEFNLLDLKKIFEEIIDKTFQSIHTPEQENDPKIRKPDITLAREKLNFNPKIDLKTGINKTYEWFKNNSLKK
jgi:UDP-glucuronate decarboxylase